MRDAVGLAERAADRVAHDEAVGASVSAAARIPVGTAVGNVFWWCGRSAVHLAPTPATSLGGCSLARVPSTFGSS